ncbi:hypothetical protein [Leptolyngbya sp. AN03gr2]|uniref:hypothetical protein n=1 Tax=Leptolyngbya sp. AN03gr2 TaxID=3423364 RepID=UPI003D31DFF9
MGTPNFIPSQKQDCPHFVGRVITSTTTVPVFYVEADFDRTMYWQICQEVKELNHTGKYHVFATGYELLQSPSVMFHRINQAKSGVLEYE